MSTAVIVGAARTAIGNFGGALKGMPAPALGAVAIKEALRRAACRPEEVGEVLMGNAVQAGLGQNPARQAALGAGLPVSVPAVTINKACASGLQAVALAAQSIAVGAADVVVAGGMENMSRAPYLLADARHGYRLGDGKLVDGLIADGLWDVYGNYHMGITAETLAEKYGVSREDQDRFAAQSQARCAAAVAGGKFAEEIIPLPVPQPKGEPLVFDKDEYPKPDTTVERLTRLKPAFKAGGTVTAGNASGINDGAAVVVVMSAARAQAQGIAPLAEIVAWSAVGVEPAVMGIGPAKAVPAALQRAQLKLAEIELVELNEAFAAQSLAVIRELGLDMARVNVNGGAIALGHPIGASGARILVTLLHEMRRRAATLGLATLCVGGGEGVAMIVKRI
jgi:acetyl-CoA C-acetyltransferase